tara:strand:- start:7571 stop:7759 length:189 start_codon:yes stop_codon:yes gene_type:complete
MNKGEFAKYVATLMEDILAKHYPEKAPIYRKTSISKEDFILGLMEAYMIGRQSHLDEIRSKI